MEHRGRASYLTSALGARTKNRFTELLVPLGIAPPHFGVLREISGADGPSQQEVADLMGIRRSVMVGLVDDLEGAGLVTRGRRPADRRAHALRLTAAGRRALTRADRLADRVDAELLAPLEPSQQTAFVAALHTIGAATGLSCGVFDEAQQPPQRSA